MDGEDTMDGDGTTHGDGTVGAGVAIITMVGDFLAGVMPVTTAGVVIMAMVMEDPTITEGIIIEGMPTTEAEEDIQIP